MNYRLSPIPPPSRKEKYALRLMIVVGVVSVVFFLHTVLQHGAAEYYPLYVLLIVTMVYYCFKYLHEWYHYFSISSIQKKVVTRQYTVDILTTYCAGEPFHMLEETLTAIQHITYPHTAWCCDEADDPDVKQLCLRLGVQHVTRTDKKDAKAGNINNALQFATGELCVVLDPDHVPAPEFLDQVAGYFDDPGTGFVQVVQAYYNQRESLVAKGAAQQTYQFYGPMMMAMQSYGTVQAIGANCTFRRSALDSIGGHSSGLAEDMHTAMQLHAKGWKSVYVPIIVTRGLVPATMSSYYKQQLKWSRGTWELLLVTYPKLFKNFTWRQKIHYFTLPFHYLLGFIFFINFLIPVISLFTGYVPLQMDVFNFLLASFPLFAMSILIRHYVQKWVAEDTDRGFHIIGGILQIGTWWIYIVGFMYTIFRKKIPYIPTPKNDNDPLPLRFNIPNILIAAISLGAILYGLKYDYNPYTLFMVVLASMQIFFMVFILFISGYTNDTSLASDLATKLRQHTWLIEKSHGFLRKYSLSLSFLLVAAFLILYNQQQKLPGYLPKSPPGLQVFYRGLYLSNNSRDDITSGAFLSSSSHAKDVAIFAMDLPWGESEKNMLDLTLLDKIYARNAMPLLNLQLWQKDSATGTFKDTTALEGIANGKYDAQVKSFASQAAAIGKPLFISFDTTVVMNKYSLFAGASGKAEQFVAAWKYLHGLFDKAGADKVIWVWKAGNTTTTIDYFPGNAYADWIAVDVPQNNQQPGSANSLDEFYRPYHQLQLFKSGLPVMLLHAGASKTANHQWWAQAWNSIDTAFTEIKSVIINIPTAGTTTQHAMATSDRSNIWQGAPKATLPLPFQPRGSAQVTVTTKYSFPQHIKSVGYNKGYYWFRNRHTVNQRVLQLDIAEMKQLGINTVERTMPGFYDDNLEKLLEINGMSIIPCFKILATAAVVNDQQQMREQQEKILRFVKMHLAKKNIIAWNVGDDVLGILSTQTFLPDYFYYQQKYIEWLKIVCRQIRSVDSVRPIIMNLNWNENGRKRFHYYREQVPQIDKFMLVADAKYKEGLTEPLEEGMAWGKVDLPLWPLLPAIQKSGAIPEWQDIENVNFVNLNGLLDMDGRRKQWYKMVKNKWANGGNINPLLPGFKILKHARLTIEGSVLTYQVIEKKGDRWQLYKDDVPGLRFEWYLVRTDQYENTMFIKKVGGGSSLPLSIPFEPQYYKLMLEVVKGNDVEMLTTSLNTPLE